MSPITDPSEEYFKDGLWGWVVNQWKKLIADAAGHLQVDVVASGLPAGGATSANQATMITALQLIDDLRNALNSIATDELDIVFDGQNLDVEVTQTAPADLCTGIHGWDGSVWRKLPLLWGYSAHYCENPTGIAVLTGDAVATGTTVPDDEVWVIEALAVRHDALVPKWLLVRVFNNGCVVRLICESAAVSLQRYFWNGRLTLPPGGNLEALAVAPGDGRSVYLYCWGYKMSIAE